MFSPILLFGFGLCCLAFWLGERSEDRQTQLALEGVEFDDELTSQIYEAAQATGLNPEEEMERMRESVLYAIVFRCGERFDGVSGQCNLCFSSAGWEHSDHCECAKCQTRLLPPEHRSPIFAGLAHTRTCCCDLCRSKYGIDAEKALALLLTQSTLTTSPSDLAGSDPSTASASL